MPQPAHSAPSSAGDGLAFGVSSAPATPSAPDPSQLSVEVTPCCDRTEITLCGELDLDSGRHVEVALHVALDHCGRDVVLHLEAVSFCDCAGLGALLRLRTRALEQRKTVTLAASSRAVDRVLDLTGTRPLFTSPDTRDTVQTAPTCPAFQVGSDQKLRAETAHLRRAMQTRPVIDLARGILMANHPLSPEAAWKILVAASQKTNTKLHRLAQDVVDHIQGAPLAEAVHQQLTDAIAEVTAAPPLSSPGPPARHSDVPPQRTAPPRG
ncbi:ANTAR domain-containing protein [Streptomyces rimosus]|uniref:ANTAR domain-containing protein n=1 Tax=Streptomyces rimosus TaxID=1927 RepID=UPI0037D34C4B